MIMKNVICGFLCAFFPIYGNEIIEVTPLLDDAHKIYLDPASLAIFPDRIEAVVEGNITPINFLFVDANGFYTLIPNIEAWRCSCEAVNPEYVYTCWKCHKSKP